MQFRDKKTVLYLRFRDKHTIIILVLEEIAMILKRKIYQDLLEWKKNNGTTALLIEGARRVGKSFICKQFAENEYKSHILIDFSNPPNEVIDLFLNESTNFDLFFTKLSTFYNTELYKRNSLFVFDEVQLFPRARQLIKHLVADGRYDYLETGSLITLKQNIKDIVIPSEEDSIEMFPLDFEEFLWAMGSDLTISFLEESYKLLRPLGRALHRKIMNDFRQYVLVGGMPQAVVEYVKSKDFASVDRIKKRILKVYRNDITKFAGENKTKVTAIFDSIPGQLSKKAKTYKLSSLGKNARMRRYEDAFIWLDEAMVVNPCYNTTDPNIGLALSSDHNTQKIYMADSGLLITHAFRDKKYLDNELYKAILFDNLGINEGMIMENIVAQILRSNGHQLYFYSRRNGDSRKKSIEIDFIISKNNKICPIEVKSSSYRKHSSLDKFRNKFKRKIGDAYILYQKDIMIKDDVIHLPLYMAMLL